MPPRHDLALDRIRHVQGEKLAAADLRDEYANTSGMRGLHVVALHDAWGIALGLDVARGPGGTMVVGGGLAYDALGRELVVADETVVAGPQNSVASFTPGGWELWMALPEPAASSPPYPPHDAGNALPEFRWKRPGTGRPGVEVPLSACSVSLDGPGALDASIRCYAATLTRPHIAAGATASKQRWTPWYDAAGDSKQLLGIQTVVDTRGAGFVATPVYLASLQVTPPSSTPQASRGILWDPSWQFMTHVADERPGSFVFRLILLAPPSPVIGIAGPPAAGANHLFIAMERAAVSRASLSFALPIKVTWIGVEPESHCAPELDLLSLYRRLQPRTVAGSGLDLRSAFTPKGGRV